MATNFEKFQTLLEELFQLDQADLDFGIYRIMNQKRDEVVRFLEKDLLPQVKEAFSQYQSADKVELQKQLDKLVEQVSGAGMSPDDSPKVQELRQQMADSSVDVTALGNEVFSHLFSFFRRYYHEGDFISLRRYKEGVYAIPYEGEEVKLHWANHDQYYIKSSEYFRDYIFTMPSGKRVKVHLVAASTEQDNKKEQAGKERRFIICEEDPIYEENGELFIRFEYRSDNGKKKQDALNTEAIERVLQTEGIDDWVQELGKLAPTKANPNRTVLEKHLKQYTARNTFDYFIHKDLGGFLRRELDFYIKNEVMHLDDIENDTVPRVEQYLSKIKVIRKIAHKIIQFLEQLENFQKKLWLKKKFVVETNYCITLDRVPEELYAEIAANDAQREEWVRLFAIEEVEGDLVTTGYSVPLSIPFLKAHQNLVLDTRHFPFGFLARLLASLDNLDETIQGVAFNSENYQAIHLIGAKLSSVRFAYLDPPYNTESDSFLYKDNYMHSTWISMIADRLSLLLRLASPDALIACSIDDNEAWRLSALRESFVPACNTPPLFVQVRYEGKTLTEDMDFQKLIEQVVLFPNQQYVPIKPTKEYSFEKFTKRVVLKGEGQQLYLGDRECRVFSSKEYDIIDCPPSRDSLKEIWATGSVLEKNSSGRFFRDFLAGREKTDGLGSLYMVPDIGGDGHEYRFFTGPKRAGATKGKYFQGVPLNREEGQITESVIPNFLTLADSFGNCRHEGGVDFRSGKKPEVFVEKLLNLSLRDDDDGWTLEPFAGSASLSAVSSKRGHKWFAIEMGEYFTNKTLLRMKRVLYGDTTGLDRSEDAAVGSGVFKYCILESYDEALNNLEIKQTDQQASLLEEDDNLREQYVLSYMLDVESRGSQSLLNVESFRNPDEYKLKVERNGETQLVNVDLVETFNWLLGLTVMHIDVIRDMRVVEGTSPDGDRVLVLWRNLDKTDNSALDEWFKKQGYNTKDQEYDVVYVNGDNNLENLKRGNQTWKVRLTEEDFGRLMFDVEDV